MITRRLRSTGGPTWFDGCFCDEPADVSPLEVLELAKTSVRRRRLIGAAATVAMLTVLALVAGLTASSALPRVRVRTAVPSPAPFLGSSAPDLAPMPPTASSTVSP